MPNYNISLEVNHISIKDVTIECLRLYCPVRFYCEITACGKNAKLVFKTQDGDFDMMYSDLKYLSGKPVNLSIEGVKDFIDQMILDCVCCSGEVEMTMSENKSFEYICDYRDDTNVDIPERKRPIVTIESWLDPITKNWCYVLQGEDVNVASNLLTISNYTKMSSERLGNVPVITNDLKTKKGTVIDICAGVAGRTVTLADLAAEIAADIATRTAKNPPEDGYEWALLGLEVNQHPAKKKLHCDLTDTDGDVTSSVQVNYAFGADSGQFVTIGDSADTIIKALPDADACGCLNDRSCLMVEADFTTPLTLPANTGLEVCPILVCVVVA